MEYAPEYVAIYVIQTIRYLCYFLTSELGGGNDGPRYVEIHFQLQVLLGN